MKTRLSRRQFLSAGAAAGAGLLLTDPAKVLAATRPRPALPPTGAGAPFDHVVILMMENRSFDHFLGWLPGANGIQAGLQFTDTAGVTYPTYNLAPDYEGCGYADPDHSWSGGLTQMNGGRMDGFLKTAAPGDTFPIGYYTKDTVNVLGSLVQGYGTSDNYHCAILSATYPNRFYQHSAQTDRDSTTPSPPSTLPAIWDQLTPLPLNNTPPPLNAVTGRYYSTDLPFTALYVNKYLDFTFQFEQFLADCQTGNLPNVAFVDPEFAGEGQGFSRDDHPHADVRAGEFFIYQVYNAIRQSPVWDRTVLIINYDEWGGFYDHVVPPHVIDDKPLASNLQMDTTRLGFRVPLAVVSPLVPQGTLIQGGAPFEHTSALRMIEWRFGLNAMTARDANARNLAEFLDLTSPARTDTVAVPVPNQVVSEPCTPANSTPNPPEPVAAVPEFPWTPGLTTGAAAIAAGWIATKKMTTRSAGVRSIQELDQLTQESTAAPGTR